VAEEGLAAFELLAPEELLAPLEGESWAGEVGIAGADADGELLRLGLTGAARMSAAAAVRAKIALATIAFKVAIFGAHNGLLATHTEPRVAMGCAQLPRGGGLRGGQSGVAG
jgi:hypothetical protein